MTVLIVLLDAPYRLCMIRFNVHYTLALKPDSTDDSERSLGRSYGASHRNVLHTAHPYVDLHRDEASRTSRLLLASLKIVTDSLVGGRGLEIISRSTSNAISTPLKLHLALAHSSDALTDSDEPS